MSVLPITSCQAILFGAKCSTVVCRCVVERDDMCDLPERNIEGGHPSSCVVAVWKRQVRTTLGSLGVHPRVLWCREGDKCEPILWWWYALQYCTVVLSTYVVIYYVGECYQANFIFYRWHLPQRWRECSTEVAHLQLPEFDKGAAILCFDNRWQMTWRLTGQN